MNENIKNKIKFYGKRGFNLIKEEFKKVFDDSKLEFEYLKLSEIFTIKEKPELSFCGIKTDDYIYFKVTKLDNYKQFLVKGEEIKCETDNKIYKITKTFFEKESIFEYIEKEKKYSFSCYRIKIES